MCRITKSAVNQKEFFVAKLLTRHGPREFQMSGGREDDLAVNLVIAEVWELVYPQGRLPNSHAFFGDHFRLAFQKGMFVQPMPKC